MQKRLLSKTGAYWLGAVALWLGLGLSLGYYYTITYYGRTGLPMPLLEVCGALVLYYFSVLNAADWIQAIHWMLVFPLAGWAWVESLRRCAVWLGDTPPPTEKIAWILGLTTLPLIVTAPWLAIVCGQTPSGFQWSHMIAVALRHEWVDPWRSLNPTFLGLGFACLILQVMVYPRLFTFRGLRAVRHVGLSMIAATLANVIIGAGIALPLRWILE